MPVGVAPTPPVSTRAVSTSVWPDAMGFWSLTTLTVAPPAHRHLRDGERNARSSGCVVARVSAIAGRDQVRADGIAAAAIFRIAYAVDDRRIERLSVVGEGYYAGRFAKLRVFARRARAVSKYASGVEAGGKSLTIENDLGTVGDRRSGAYG